MRVQEISQDQEGERSHKPAAPSRTDSGAGSLAGAEFSRSTDWSPSDLLALQRLAGNAAVTLLVADQPRDRYEKKKLIDARISNHGFGAQRGEAQAPKETPPGPSPRIADIPSTSSNQGLTLTKDHVPMVQRTAEDVSTLDVLARSPDTTGAPQVRTWKVSVHTGGLGAGVARFLGPGRIKVFVRDTVIVRAVLSAATKEDLAWSANVSPTMDVVGSREDARTVKWEVLPKQVGTHKTKFAIGSEGKSAAEYEFHVVTDVEDLGLACTQALGTLTTKFVLAIGRINEAATAWKKAYDEQKDVLDELAASNRMTSDLAFGVLFAAAGGMAGGAVGQYFKTYEHLSKQDYLIDTAKDTVKFSVRSLDRLRGGGSASTPGDSTATPSTDPFRATGEYRPAGEDPLEFLTNLSAEVAGEAAAANAALDELIDQVRVARQAGSKADFDEDPIALVTTKGSGLDLLSSQLQTDKKLYLKGLWQEWLNHHGPIGARGRGPFQALRLRKAIDSAAAAVGESGDAWDLAGRQEPGPTESEKMHWRPL